MCVGLIINAKTPIRQNQLQGAGCMCGVCRRLPRLQVSRPPLLRSRCATLSRRGNFRVGDGFVCTGRGPGGGDGGRALSPPILLFIGSLTTARTAAAPPLFHVCRASRHYLPPPRAVIRCQSGLRLGGRGIKAGPRRALAGVRRGGGRGGFVEQCFPAPGTSLATRSTPGRGLREPRGMAGRRRGLGGGGTDGWRE